MALTKVLFLCTGNSARSQMAEAFLGEFARGRFEAYSAGLNPSDINPYTRRVMEEIGFNLDGQFSKGVEEYLGKVNFGYLITVCDHAEQNCPTTFLGISHRLHWSFEDPAAFEGSDQEKLAKFRQVRDLIKQRVEGWLAAQEVGGSD